MNRLLQISLFFRFTIYTLGLFATLFLLAGWYFHINKQQLETKTLTHYLIEQQRAWQAVRQTHINGMEAYFSSYVTQPAVLKLLHQMQSPDPEIRDQARVLLYRELVGVYELLTTRGVRQFQFFTTDSHSLLRLHHPHRFGDPLAELRPGVALANHTRTRVSGFESGRVVSGFRNIFPILDGDTHLGAVELSQPFEALRSSMQQLFSDADTEFLLLINASGGRELFSEQQRLYAISTIDPDWLVEDPLRELYDSPPPLSPVASRIAIGLSQVEGFSDALNAGTAASFTVRQDGGFSVVTQIPVIDLSGRLGAALIAFQPSDALEQIDDNFTTQLWMSAAASLLLALAIALTINRIHKVREQRQRLRAITHAVHSGVYVMDHAGRIIFSNRRASEILGYSSKEMNNHNAHNLFHVHSSSPAECPLFLVIARGETYRHEESFRCKNGEIISVDVASAPVVLGAGENGAVVAFEDITERKQLEAQLLQAQKMESVGTLAGGVAHDFNNILSSITGFTWLALKKMEEGNPLRRNLEQVLAATDRASSLTKDLLLFSRKHPKQTSVFDLNELLTKTESLWRRTLHVDIHLVINPAPRPLSVVGDFHQLQQILMNLFLNACDAIDTSGQINLTTEQFSLKENGPQISGLHPGEYALLKVRDNGTGMDQETLKHIFEPFYTTKSVEKGTGLGLAVVYGIVQQHKGVIRVDSQPGKGTCFCVYLPLNQDICLLQEPEQKESAPPQGSETILLAEDDPQGRRALTGILSEAGYRVITAVNGEDAVQHFMEDPENIDLLLFDLIMPLLNGKDAADAINKFRPGTRTLFISGYPSDNISINGADHILPKPINPRELLFKVRDVLDG